MWVRESIVGKVSSFHVVYIVFVMATISSNKKQAAAAISLGDGHSYTDEECVLFIIWMWFLQAVFVFFIFFFDNRRVYDGVTRCQLVFECRPQFTRVVQKGRLCQLYQQSSWQRQRRSRFDADQSKQYGHHSGGARQRFAKVSSIAAVAFDRRLCFVLQTDLSVFLVANCYIICFLKK